MPWVTCNRELLKDKDLALVRYNPAYTKIAFSNSIEKHLRAGINPTNVLSMYPDNTIKEQILIYLPKEGVLL